MNDATLDTAPARADIAPKIPLQKILVALIRRELWEHRALWMVPLILAALLLLAAAFSHFDGQGMRVGASGSSPHSFDMSVEPGPEESVSLLALSQWFMSVPLYLAAAIVLYFYLLAALFDERKDRSILFWKSLPVSDGATVTSKFLMALVVVPLGVFLLSVVAQLLCAAILEARSSLGLLRAAVVWNTADWLKVEGLALTGVVASSLWYAPVAAYLLLVSAWARRNVFLWAVLPPVILAIFERIAFGSLYVTNILKYRLGEFGLLGRVTAAFTSTQLSYIFANIDLWLGLVVAVALAYCAARIRRYRDDT